MSGSLVAAVSVLALSGPVVADVPGDPDYQNPPTSCGALIEAIISMADELRCGEWPTSPEQIGTWDKGNPIWKKKGDAVKGCEVHESLAKQLYFVRDPNGTKPRIKKGGNSKGGAANDLDNGKVLSAMTHLMNFSETIRTAAKVNPKFEPLDTAGKVAEDFAHQAEDHLLPYVNLCSK